MAALEGIAGFHTKPERYMPKTDQELDDYVNIRVIGAFIHVMSSLAPHVQDQVFYNIPNQHLLEVAMHFKNADWCQYAVNTDPECAFIRTASQREAENYHELNAIMDTWP
jgi:hypothetical protein